MHQNRGGGPGRPAAARQEVDPRARHWQGRARSHHSPLPGSSSEARAPVSEQFREDKVLPSLLVNEGDTMQQPVEEQDTAEKFHRYKIDTELNTVHHAARVGDLKKLDEHVTAGIHQGNPESVTLQQRENLLGMMPLHIACEHGQIEAVEYLVKKRVDIDAGDFFRVTPLHLACIENQYEISRILLKSRATVGVVDLEGDLPIHWAATKGHPDIIELLVTNKSPVDPTNKSGWTPLHRAVYNNRKDAAAALVKLGASMSAKNKDGNTPLHLACFMGYLDVMELLLSLGAKMELLNNRDQTVLDLCINDGARETLDKWGFKYAVIKKGGDVKGAGAAALASATAGMGKLGVKAASPTASKPSKSQAQTPSCPDDFPDLGGALNTSFTSGPIVQSRLSIAGGDKSSRTSGSGVVNLSPAGPSRHTSHEAGAPLPPRLDLSSPLARAASRSTSLREAGATSPLPSPSHQAHHHHQLDPAVPRPPSNHLRLGQGAPLPPIGAGPSSPGPDPSAAPPRAEPLAQGGDHMETIRQENRRLASRESLNASRRRPASANKKFLSRYGLDKHSLFAPT